MRKLLKSPGLVRCEVPEELDRRILLQAALTAHKRRQRRSWRWIGTLSGMAAAAAVAVFALLPGTAERFSAPETGRGELLELSDWTSLEQEGFNLSSQLNCGWQE